MDNINLKLRFDALAVFKDLKNDAVLKALYKYLEAPTVRLYAEFVTSLYEANGGHLGEYIKDICQMSENVYVKTLGRGEMPSSEVEESVAEELKTLQELSELTKKELRGLLEWQGFLPDFASGNVNIAECFKERTENIAKYGYGIYAGHRMFYLDGAGRVTPVKNPDSISLDALVDYEAQRQRIIDNTKALLANKPAANILLTGDAGTGKSSTVKAVANALFSEGLRIIEIRKDQLRSIPKLLDELADNPLKFVLFIDDLSFLKDDDNFNALKAVLEGSVSAKSKNVVIYATSNRRHIIKERFSDREGDDVHRNDTMQEIVSLSDRFGMHITFAKPDKKTFLNIVRHLAEKSGIEVSDKLEMDAERFALERGGRSARLARQFIDGSLSKQS